MNEPRSWPAGGGETGALIRARDWSRTALGPVERWPQSLRAAVDIMLEAPVPTAVLWGPALVQLYNDAYIPIAQERHPAIFGQPALQSWADARDLLAPLLEGILAGGPPAILQDQRVPLRGADGAEMRERVFRAAFSAIRDEGGRVGGIFHSLQETTASVRAQEALRESEARFRQLAEHAREIFWLFSADLTEALYVSPAHEQVWGRPPEELYRDPGAWLDAVHPDDRERMRQVTASLAERETSFEFRIVRPDGKVRWLWTRSYPIPDEATGEIVRIGGVTEDITAEKEGEERLQFLAEAGRVLNSSLGYEETLRNVARLAVAYFADWCVVDVLEDGEIRRLCVAHADPDKEALAWEIVRRFPPDARALAGVAHSLRTGQPQVYEVSSSALRQVSQSKEHRRLLEALGLRWSMIVPMVARERTLGAITFIAAESGRAFGPDDLPFAEEIAARAAVAVDNARLYRQAEQSRGEAERRARQEAALRRAAEAVSATFTISDVIQQIAVNSLQATNADGAFVKRLLNQREVEVVAVAGESVPEVGARAPYAGSFSELAMQRGEPVLVPNLADAPRASTDWMMRTCGRCSALIVPLVDAGEAIGTLVLTRAPERRGFRPDEIERARTFADLASLAFRKIHLLQDSEQRREELESVMESRARLIRGFSHDVKNPLGAADGYLDLIEAGIIRDPDQLELSIGRARRAIRSAMELIQDLSELARAEAGQIEIEREPVDLRVVASEMAEEYRAQAGAKGLDLTYHLPREFPIIESDASRIRQILGNLVSNAVKYTDRGRIELRLHLREDEGAGTPERWAVIAVADSGPGIAPEKQHLLFREFSRLDPGKASGAGLGLAISQRIAEALAGTIRVESEPGRGSTFSLWLPTQGPPVSGEGGGPAGR